MKYQVGFFMILSILNLSEGLSQKKVASDPNIVLIFLDDMGNGDLSSTGALKYTTPILDKLGSDGIRFTNFLTAQAVCSASRAALLTGCYPNRIGFSGALFPNSPIGINSSELTMAELVKQKGYATGIIGKWHLGDSREFLPLQHGFDEYFGLPYSNDMWPIDFAGQPATDWTKDRFPPLHIMDGNDKKIPVATLDDQANLTKQYTNRAVDFINNHKSKPFFLYLAHSMPHVPINASAQFKGKSKQGLYGDVMMEIDWSVGEVLKAIQKNGLDENTLIIFTSDNGPWLNFGNHAGSTGGLREGKGDTFEGGMRVPCIMRWKGTIREGLISNNLSSTIDIFPTIAELLHVKLPDHKIDGLSLVPVLNGDVSTAIRKEFYYYYRRNNLEAVRLEDWKLVLPHPGRSYENFKVGRDGFPGDTNEDYSFPKALYDLRRDPGERYNVIGQFPEIVKELEELAEKAREDLGDDLTQRTGRNVRVVGQKQ